MKPNFRYEILSVDTGLFSRIKALFTRKHNTIVHGQYFIEEKAKAHVYLLRAEGKSVYLFDTKYQLRIL